MIPLPDDICRCRDDDCSQSRQCVRWIQRDLGSSRLVSAATLFPFETLSVVNDPCPFFIAEAAA